MASKLAHPTPREETTEEEGDASGEVMRELNRDVLREERGEERGDLKREVRREERGEERGEEKEKGTPMVPAASCLRARRFLEATLGEDGWARHTSLCAAAAGEGRGMLDRLKVHLLDVAFAAPLPRELRGEAARSRYLSQVEAATEAQVAPLPSLPDGCLCPPPLPV